MRLVVLLTLVGALITLAIYAFQDQQQPTKAAIIDNRNQAHSQWSKSPPTASHTEVLPTEPAEPSLAAQESAQYTETTAVQSVSMPTAEQEFILAVQQGQAAFLAAPNEMAQGGTRFQRRLAICRSLPALAVADWVGQIAQLSSNSDGKGVLQISLAPDIRVETWNNDLSDIGSDTLIDPSSPLFSTLMRMNVGTQVLFSGAFMSSNVDCVNEHSMSLEGSMTDPEFGFRFTSVRSIQ